MWKRLRAREPEERDDVVASPNGQAAQAGTGNVAIGGDGIVVTNAPKDGGQHGWSNERKRLVGGVASFFVAVAAGVTVHLVTRGGDEADTPRPMGTGETVVVDNRVTNGPTVMREDVPAYLSYETRSFCDEGDCRVPGSRLQTGDRLEGVVCQETGDLVTNGDRTSAADDDNPALVESDRWYGVRLDNGRVGYISEVWIDAIDRGGLRLPNCSTTEPGD